MPRPRKDGSAASPARKRKLTELYVKRVRAELRAFVVWDTHQHGLALKVQPTGARAYKTVYRYHNRPRWFHLGNARAISLGDARKLAARVMLQAAEGAAEHRCLWVLFSDRLHCMKPRAGARRAR